MGWVKLKWIEKISHLPFLQKQGGAITMGMTSGLIAAPCTVPVLGVILTYIALEQSIIFGAMLMFVFSLGLGLLLFLLGVFTGLLTSLPKSGQWMEILEKISAIVFMGIGIYFLVKGVR